MKKQGCQRQLSFTKTLVLTLVKNVHVESILGHDTTLDTTDGTVYDTTVHDAPHDTRLDTRRSIRRKIG